MMNRYTATATREGAWWVISVDGIGVTQAHSLADAPAMARELIAVTLDIPLSSIEVSVSVPD